MKNLPPQINTIRIGVALMLAIFTIEIILGFGLTPFEQEGLLSIILPFPNYSHYFKENIILKIALILITGTTTVLLAANKFTKQISYTIVALTVINLITSDETIYSPLKLLFESYLHLGIIGSALALAAPKRKATSIIRITLSITLGIIFISAFFWTENSNLIWSYHFSRLTSSINWLTFPVIAAIIGSISALIAIGIYKKTTAIICALLFSALAISSKFSAYSYTPLIYFPVALLSQEDIFRTLIPQKKKKQKN